MPFTPRILFITEAKSREGWGNRKGEILAVLLERWAGSGSYSSNAGSSSSSGSGKGKIQPSDTALARVRFLRIALRSWFHLQISENHNWNVNYEVWVSWTGQRNFYRALRLTGHPWVPLKGASLFYWGRVWAHLWAAGRESGGWVGGTCSAQMKSPQDKGGPSSLGSRCGTGTTSTWVQEGGNCGQQGW